MDAEQATQFQYKGQDIPWLLATWATAQPDKTFLIWEPRDGQGRQWTYAEFWNDVRQIAVGLAGRGVGYGDKVLIHADNCPEMVLAWYACATVGAVGVTTNTRSVQAELEFFITKTGCVGAVTQPQYASLVAAAGPQLGWIVVTADNSGDPATPEQAAHGFDGFDTLIGAVEDLVEREPDPMAPVGILFTSGTTSQPKAVVHTHANALWAGRVGPTNILMEHDDTYLVFLPFFHVNAQSWSFWTTLGVGGTIVLQPKFSSSRFWEVVLKHKVTHISLIPFVYNAVAGQPIPEHSVKVGVFGDPRHQRPARPAGAQGVDGPAHPRLRAAPGRSRDG
jgi:crotonobetaine/carnitine-CoA ligase